MLDVGRILPGKIRNRPLDDRLRMRNSPWLKLFVLMQLFIAAPVIAGPLFDTSTPLSFFTNVASRLLSAQLNVNLSHLEVYPTNQYTPAVHRLLQVTANILDAQNTSFYPTVFRPLFAADTSNNIFIIGYQQVTGVSGTNDPQLSLPYDVSALLTSCSNAVPMTDSNGPVNVYGIPWVLGVKRGFPNFNQLSLVSAAQFSRKLKVMRTSLDPTTALYETNQIYTMGISNILDVVFWNSYSNSYPHPLTVSVSDTLLITLANGFYTWSQVTNFNYIAEFNSWSGSKWSGAPPEATPQTASFLVLSWPETFQSPLSYDSATHRFDANALFRPISQYPQLDQVNLVVTNYFQAFILDGTNVVDYVQLCSPTAAAGLNQALADPIYPQPNGIYYQWSTNALRNAIPPNIPYGAINQLWVSGHPTGAPTGGIWSTAQTPMGVETPAAEAAYFNGFFTPTFLFNGITYVNHQSEMQAPYTPSRTVYTSVLLQANDPLVHYLAGDMGSYAGTLAVWAGKQQIRNGIWSYSDDLTRQPLPIAPTSPILGRYQPWGLRGQLADLVAVDTNVWNLTYKDPLVWGSDYWNFPTGQNWSLSWLGQVHRGTPWQTIYLKSTNILSIYQNFVFQGLRYVGTNTWVAWTGDSLQNSPSGQYLDAVASAPPSDWQLVSLLAAMLNTNDLSAQFSVNNPDPNAWSSLLDGITVLTNLPPVIQGANIEPQFNTMVISSNSPQASLIANAIQTVRFGIPNQAFHNIGDILATSQLSLLSPYLSINYPPFSLVSLDYGISDQAYEAIPSQLLPLLRMDSIGQISATNGETHAQFTGYDGRQYAVQLSPDLLNWISISTNSPTNGVFGVDIPASSNTPSQFYRTVLIQ